MYAFLCKIDVVIPDLRGSSVWKSLYKCSLLSRWPLPALAGKEGDKAGSLAVEGQGQPVEATGTVLKALVGKRHGKEISEPKLGGTHTDTKETTVRLLPAEAPSPQPGLLSLSRHGWSNLHSLGQPQSTAQPPSSEPIRGRCPSFWKICSDGTVPRVSQRGPWTSASHRTEYSCPCRSGQQPGRGLSCQPWSGRSCSFPSRKHSQ